MHMEGRSKFIAICCIVITGTVFWFLASKSSHIYSKQVEQIQRDTTMDKAMRQATEDRIKKYDRKITAVVQSNRSDKSCSAVALQHARFYSQSSEDKALFREFFWNSDGTSLCDGTFVEIGALDGKTYSNSLFFERSLNWNGVLIEGNPELTDLLNANRPNTKNFGGLCPCPQNQTEVLFVVNGNQAIGGVLDHMSAQHFQAYFKEESNFINVPCKPMGTILHDAGVHAVDIFFIDVEGSEHVVLQTMDWTIPVRIVMVEMGHSDAKDRLIREYLEQQGFVNTLPEWNIMSYCESGGDCAQNEVFINPNYPGLPDKKS